VLGSIRYGTVRLPVSLNSSSENPALAPGQGLYSTVKSRRFIISLTRRQNGDASYSYNISGTAGLGASPKTVLVSRIEKGPSFNAYFPLSGFANQVSIFQPNTNTPVPKRDASAKAPENKLGSEERRVIVRGLGSGAMKSGGFDTLGVAGFGLRVGKLSNRPIPSLELVMDNALATIGFGTGANASQFCSVSNKDGIKILMFVYRQSFGKTERW